VRRSDDAFQQVAQLRRRDRHRLILRSRPHEAAAIQALGEQAHPLAVVPQDLHQTTALAAEHEQVTTVRVSLQRLLHQQRQTVEVAPHIRCTARQPHPRLGPKADHRPRARRTRPRAASSTPPSTRTRTTIAQLDLDHSHTHCRWLLLRRYTHRQKAHLATRRTCRRQ